MAYNEFYSGGYPGEVLELDELPPDAFIVTGFEVTDNRFVIGAHGKVGTDEGAVPEGQDDPDDYPPVYPTSEVEKPTLEPSTEETVPDPTDVPELQRATSPTAEFDPTVDAPLGVREPGGAGLYVSKSYVEAVGVPLVGAGGGGEKPPIDTDGTRGMEFPEEPEHPDESAGESEKVSQTEVPEEPKDALEGLDQSPDKEDPFPGKDTREAVNQIIKRVEPYIGPMYKIAQTAEPESQSVETSPPVSASGRAAVPSSKTESREENGENTDEITFPATAREAQVETPAEPLEDALSAPTVTVTANPVLLEQLKREMPAPVEVPPLPKGAPLPVEPVAPAAPEGAATQSAETPLREIEQQPSRFDLPKLYDASGQATPIDVRRQPGQAAAVEHAAAVAFDGRSSSFDLGQQPMETDRGLAYDMDAIPRQNTAPEAMAEAAGRLAMNPTGPRHDNAPEVTLDALARIVSGISNLGTDKEYKLSPEEAAEEERRAATFSAFKSKIAPAATDDEPEVIFKSNKPLPARTSVFEPNESNQE